MTQALYIRTILKVCHQPERIKMYIIKYLYLTKTLDTRQTCPVVEGLPKPRDYDCCGRTGAVDLGRWTEDGRGPWREDGQTQFYLKSDLDLGSGLNGYAVLFARSKNLKGSKCFSCWRFTLIRVCTPGDVLFFHRFKSESNWSWKMLLKIYV